LELQILLIVDELDKVLVLDRELDIGWPFIFMARLTDRCDVTLGGGVWKDIFD
jgi:hypothetical protein